MQKTAMCGKPPLDRKDLHMPACNWSEKGKEERRRDHIRVEFVVGIQVQVQCCVHNVGNGATLHVHV